MADKKPLADYGLNSRNGALCDRNPTQGLRILASGTTHPSANSMFYTHNIARPFANFQSPVPTLIHTFANLRTLALTLVYTFAKKRRGKIRVIYGSIIKSLI